MILNDTCFYSLTWINFNSVHRTYGKFISFTETAPSKCPIGTYSHGAAKTCTLCDYTKTAPHCKICAKGEVNPEGTKCEEVMAPGKIKQFKQMIITLNTLLLHKILVRLKLITK